MSEEQEKQEQTDQEQKQEQEQKPEGVQPGSPGTTEEPPAEKG